MDFKEYIRTIEDFPKPGISFKDITTLLQRGDIFRKAIDTLGDALEGQQVDLVVGPEARGYFLAAPLAYKLGAGLVPVRKPGKLPFEVASVTYEKEYGPDTLQAHVDAIKPGQKCLVVDDLLATGGTIRATCDLVEQLGGEVIGLAFLIELKYLEGRRNLQGYRIHSLVEY